MKHFLKHIRLRFCLPLVLASVPVANATIIYSDLNMNGGWGLPSLNGELGNQVTVAGSNPFVTRLSIEIYSQGRPFPNPTGIPAGFADFQAQIYANNGTLGAPGSTLWQSPVIHVNYQPGLTLLNFDLPQVLVPNTFTWTLAYYNTSPIPPALPTAVAPTIGSNGSEWFRGQGSGAWGHSSLYNFAAQIEAVPEPNIGALLSLAIFSWQLWRKKPRCLSSRAI
jgi:hypothetical protein